MSKEKNGGPAFPHPINPTDFGRGMTLRDYFAAKAMQGLIADGALRDAANRVHSIAALSVQQADALLEALK